MSLIIIAKVNMVFSGFIRMRIFLVENHLHDKGNVPRKFGLNQLISYFAGIMEQTNKQTDRLIDRHYIALKEG